MIDDFSLFGVQVLLCEARAVNYVAVAHDACNWMSACGARMALFNVNALAELFLH